jgi:L-lysine 2,3-aminomutase
MIMMMINDHCHACRWCMRWSMVEEEVRRRIVPIVPCAEWIKNPILAVLKATLRRITPTIPGSR